MLALTDARDIRIKVVRNCWQRGNGSALPGANLQTEPCHPESTSCTAYGQDDVDPFRNAFAHAAAVDGPSLGATRAAATTAGAPPDEDE